MGARTADGVAVCGRILEDFQDVVAAGDRLVQRWRYSWGGGHIRGVDVFLLRDGRVAEKLAYVKG